MLVPDEEVINGLYQQGVGQESDNQVTEGHAGRFVRQAVGGPGDDVAPHVLLHFLFGGGSDTLLL